MITNLADVILLQHLRGFLEGREFARALGGMGREGAGHPRQGTSLSKDRDV